MISLSCILVSIRSVPKPLITASTYAKSCIALALSSKVLLYSSSTYIKLLSSLFKAFCWEVKEPNSIKEAKSRLPRLVRLFNWVWIFPISVVSWEEVLPLIALLFSNSCTALEVVSNASLAASRNLNISLPELATETKVLSYKLRISDVLEVTLSTKLIISSPKVCRAELNSDLADLNAEDIWATVSSYSLTTSCRVCKYSSVLVITCSIP